MHTLNVTKKRLCVLLRLYKVVINPFTTIKTERHRKYSSFSRGQILSDVRHAGALSTWKLKYCHINARAVYGRGPDNIRKRFWKIIFSKTPQFERGQSAWSGCRFPFRGPTHCFRCDIRHAEHENERFSVSHGWNVLQVYNVIYAMILGSVTGYPVERRNPSGASEHRTNANGIGWWWRSCQTTVKLWSTISLLRP